MVNNRLDREVENRESTQRTKTWTPPQTLPEPKPQPGWVFRYIRTTIYKGRWHIQQLHYSRHGRLP